MGIQLIGMINNNRMINYKRHSQASGDPNTILKMSDGTESFNKFSKFNVKEFSAKTLCRISVYKVK